MTCYFRHLGSFFKKVGITVTPQNKAELDKTIRQIVGTEYKDCPAAWKQVKKRIAEDEDGFAAELRNEWNSSQKGR